STSCAPSTRAAGRWSAERRARRRHDEASKKCRCADGPGRRHGTHRAIRSRSFAPDTRQPAWQVARGLLRGTAIFRRPAHAATESAFELPNDPEPRLMAGRLASPKGFPAAPRLHDGGRLGDRSAGGVEAETPLVLGDVTAVSGAQLSAVLRPVDPA